MTDEQPTSTKALVKKYLDGTCTEAEKARVEQWYLSLNDTPHELSDDDIASDLQELQHRLSEIPQRHLRLRPYLQTAAAVALICLAVGLFWKKDIKEDTTYTAAAVEDVLPGGNRATLSLDGAAGIELSKDQESLVTNGNTITYNDGTPVQATEKVQMATVTTPTAGQYQVVLPDGTHAWLNARSSIVYPTRFTGDTRTISISGEVYLKVARHRSKPFIVQTGQQQIEVLGTSFNVNAYGDDGHTLTTLAEGSLRVVHLRTKTSALLSPGQQARVSAAENIQIKEVDTDEASSWIQGLSIINDEPLASYARQIERWYDVDVDMQSAGDKRLSAIIPRNAKLSEVLQAIELKTGVKFKIEGRRVMARP